MYVRQVSKKFFILLLVGLAVWGCARQTSPTGGPQDKTPPKLVSTLPLNNSVNFTGQTIILKFDEQVDIKNPKEEIISTPPLGNKTKYEANGNNIYIRLAEKLLDSTTYSISFREAVKDKTEGNSAVNLHLAFSTGPVIDSLKIEGKAFMLKTTKPAQDITIAIFEKDTFNIFKDRPLFFSKTNKEGDFTINNLKRNAYFIYAFDDKNKNMKVDSQSEAFDFTSQPISLDSSTTVAPFYLFRVNMAVPKVISVRHSKKITQISINKKLDTWDIEQLDTTSYLPLGKSENASDLIFYKKELKDSIQVRLQSRDSLGQRLDTTVYVKPSEVKGIDTPFKINTEHHLDMNNFVLTSIVKFNKPIESIVLDSCILTLDSMYIETMKKENFKIDEVNQELTITTSLPIIKEILATNEKESKNLVKEQKTIPKKEPVKTDTTKVKKELPKKVVKKRPPTEVSILFGKGAFISVENDSSKKEIKKVPLKSEEPGSLKVEIETKEAYAILQLYSNNKLIKEVPIKEIPETKKYVFEKLPPKQYELKLLIDTNNDGKWTPGNFYKKRPAEKIITYFSKEGSEKIPIRSNWEYGPVKISDEQQTKFINKPKEKM